MQSPTFSTTRYTNETPAPIQTKLTPKNNEPLATNAFSTVNAEVVWDIIESRREPNRSITLETISPKLLFLVESLSVVGVIGSALMKDIFFKNNKKLKSQALGYGIIAEHKLIRDNRIIPIFTLGTTGVMFQKQLGGTKLLNYWQNYTAEQVMNCILVYQLLGRYRQHSEVRMKDISTTTPFMTSFESSHAKGVASYAINVFRNMNEVKFFESYLRSGKELPNKMIFIVTDLNLLASINPLMKNRLKDVLVVLDSEMKIDVPFKELFHFYDPVKNKWTK